MIPKKYQGTTVLEIGDNVELKRASFGKLIFRNNGKRNRNRGHSYERSISKEFRDMGWQNACTTRYASRMKDDQKIDIFDVDPFNVQCKATNKCINYKKVIGEMPQDLNYNVVFNKLTGKGEFVMLEKKDFYELITMLKENDVLK